MHNGALRLLARYMQTINTYFCLHDDIFQGAYGNFLTFMNATWGRSHVERCDTDEVWNRAIKANGSFDSLLGIDIIDITRYSERVLYAFAGRFNIGNGDNTLLIVHKTNCVYTFKHFVAKYKLVYGTVNFTCAKSVMDFSDNIREHHSDELFGLKPG